MVHHTSYNESTKHFMGRQYHGIFHYSNSGRLHSDH